MHLTTRIRYKDASGQESVATIPAMQKVVVGSSPAADIQLHDPRGVAQKHCEIEVTASHCQIRTLAPGLALEVGGTSVQKAELTDFNEILIGQNEIVVEVKGFEELKAAEAKQTAEAKAKKIAEHKFEFIAPEMQILKNGLRCFQFQSSENDLEILRDILLFDHSFFVTRNNRAGGEDLSKDEDDLLKDFPDDFRSENSLTLQGPLVDEDEKSSAIEDSLENYNSLLIVPKNQQVGKDEFLNDLRLVFAWLAKPVYLDFHLINGIEFLLESVFKEIRYMAYSLESEECWKIATIDASINVFADLNREDAQVEDVAPAEQIVQ